VLRKTAWFPCSGPCLVLLTLSGPRPPATNIHTIACVTRGQEESHSCVCVCVPANWQWWRCRAWHCHRRGRLMTRFLFDCCSLDVLLPALQEFAGQVGCFGHLCPLPAALPGLGPVWMRAPAPALAGMAQLVVPPALPATLPGPNPAWMDAPALAQAGVAQLVVQLVAPPALPAATLPAPTLARMDVPVLVQAGLAQLVAPPRLAPPGLPVAALPAPNPAWMQTLALAWAGVAQLVAPPALPRCGGHHDKVTVEDHR
jgi:hypothetical protein